MSHVDAGCWVDMADMIQPGGGELFFVPDDEDDLQDYEAVGDLGGRVQVIPGRYLGLRTSIVEVGLGCEDSVYRPF